ncbi:MAG: hypothetical protein HC933_10520 [Pleurocapsa sp. SU_196_0]|nr:hypothetical protein [Pleurocapsa sp. SU_196_0]
MNLASKRLQRTEAPLLMRISWLERQVTRWTLMAMGSAVVGALIGAAISVLWRR